MTFLEFLGILIIAVIIGLIFSFIFSIRGPWGSFWTFFIIILLGVWAADLWLTPVGPVLWNVAWIPLFFVGVVLALLLAASDTRAAPRGKTKAETEADVTQGDPDAAAKITAVFWIIMLFLLVAVVIGLFV
ncbi:MAG: hypothetical protein ACNS62_22820 [Candidatus Cyclobacteriaceae bacterium M3_2C_046]